MSITHVFKGKSDKFGTYAVIDCGELVIGENKIPGTGFSYRGRLSDFIDSVYHDELCHRNKALADDIVLFSNLVDVEPPKVEVNQMENIINRLRKHANDYYEQKTQDFEQVFIDCVKAADMLSTKDTKHSGSENMISSHESKIRSSLPTKLCELRVDRKDSLQELTYHLTANGYTVQTAVVWKEYPNTGIDYWMIAIFDKEQ